MTIATGNLFCQSTFNSGEALFGHLADKAILLTEDGLLQGDEATNSFVKTFRSAHAESTYTKSFSIDVTAMLTYEIGELAIENNSFPTMLIKSQQGELSPEIDLLVIHEEQNPSNDVAGIASQRMQWMELCNSHQASELVQQLYTADTYYYNRGRLLKGIEAVSTEYGYMNSPGYSLKLTPKKLVFVSSTIAYEIGMCSGSYSLPYMLVWEKQADSRWKVLLDSNY